MDISALKDIINMLRNPPARPPNAGPGGPQPVMPTGMRGYQLAVQEAQAQGLPPPTLQEWRASQAE